MSSNDYKSGRVQPMKSQWDCPFCPQCFPTISDHGALLALLHLVEHAVKELSYLRKGSV